MQQSIDLTGPAWQLAREQVLTALHCWRATPETQAQCQATPESSAAVLRSIDLACEHAATRDWLHWSKVAQREGLRSLAMELAMIGSDLARLARAQTLPREEG